MRVAFSCPQHGLQMIVVRLEAAVVLPRRVGVALPSTSIYAVNRAGQCCCTGLHDSTAADLWRD